MEILRDYKQISTSVQKIFGIDVTNSPILDSMSYQDIKQLLANCKIDKDLNQVSSLAELIFQLNEYIPALCNFVKMFLYVKHYQGIVTFLEKLFVAHVGSCIYNSKNKEYSHRERYFDRFIEVVKTTDIELNDYLEFLFAIIEDNDKTSLSNYLEPCIEFMQNIYRENYSDIKNFIEKNPNFKNTYYMLGLEFNTQKALFEIFNSENGADDALFAKILKHYYQDTMSFFDKNLDNSGNKKFHYVKILASIENPEVTARLENLYEEETNEEIRAFIKTKLGIADVTNLGCSPKHFVVSAQKKVLEPQERTLGVAFENMPLKFIDGTEADNVCKTYLINIFKQEKDLLNLNGLSEVKNLFNENDLNNFAYKIFESLKKLDDIKSAKWAVRLVSLVLNKSNEQIFDFISNLYQNNRFKEAKYFIECLIYAKNGAVLQLIKNLSDEANPKFLELKEQFISQYTEVNGVSSSDVQDCLVNDQVTEESLKTQKERLYKTFIANKSYTKEQFEETFINKKVFNELAQNLVFGEYKSNRLLNLFVLEGNAIKYISGTNSEQDGEINIKIAHSLDIDDRFDKALNYFVNPTFVQFEPSVFVVKDSEKTLSKMSNMQGILINALKFTSNMLAFGFEKNVQNENDDVTELVHVSNELNLLAEVSFETPVTSYTTTSSLGFVRFYKLNQCLKNGNAYIINKTNALSIGSIEPRYYNFVASCVSKSLKS